MCYTYNMAHRTTILLDKEARTAARELALRYDCSTSEAIRQAIVRQHDLVFGVSAETRRARLETLDRLFSLFDGNDAAEEVARLKSEDDGF